MQIKILMVEDDDDLRDSLHSYLTDVGFLVHAMASAETLAEGLAEMEPDIVILDLNLPGMDGLDAAQLVRAHEPAGLIMLTGRSMRTDRLQGLAAGADHYLVKPADPVELEMVIRNLVRRLRGPDAALVPDQDVWVLDTKHWQLRAPDGAAMSLTSAEKHLLAHLMARPGEPATRGALMPPRTHSDPDAEGRGLDVLVFRLRRKVERDCGRPLPLLSARGIGYVFAGKARLEGD
ncbi:response regulator transcription factor [Aquabacter cavernae]|uniref:response regulator transcription factor n=1 Tax=Aquabacter cavernae TaxID=2496029 RepID=UPI000F8D9CF5|nr:response regulator transcription factor [Aquabacter cavernae]